MPIFGDHLTSSSQKTYGGMKKSALAGRHPKRQNPRRFISRRGFGLLRPRRFEGQGLVK
jgi:hypothetical protein